MKALGLPPTDPRLAAMNEAQWQWAIRQVTLDIDMETRRRNDEILVIIGAINPEMAGNIRAAMDSSDSGPLIREHEVAEEARRRHEEIMATGGTAGVDEEAQKFLKSRSFSPPRDPLAGPPDEMRFEEDPDG